MDVEEIASGLSGEERKALLAFADLSAETPDLAASYSLYAKRLITPTGRLEPTDLGRAVVKALEG